MNSIGWLGGSVGPTMVGALSAYVGLSTCLSATAGVYFLFGMLLIWGIWKYMRRTPGSVPVKMPVAVEE